MKVLGGGYSRWPVFPAKYVWNPKIWILVFICVSFLLEIPFLRADFFNWFFEKNGNGGYPLENFELFTGGADTIALGNSDGGFSSAVIVPSEYREYLSLNFAPLFEGANYFSAEYFLPFAHLQYLYGDISSISIPDIPSTNELGEDIGRFGAGELLVRVGYTRGLRNNFFVGGSIKTYYQRIVDYQDSVFAFDGGCGFRSGRTDLYLLAGNIFPFKEIHRSHLYPSLRFGVRHNTKLGSSPLKLFFNVLTEGIFSDYISPLFWSTGVEYENPPNMKWRVGLNPSQYISAGFGLSFRRIDFNYGVMYHPLDFIHSIGVSVRFQIEPTEAEKRALEEMARVDDEKKSLERRAKLQKALLEEERQKLAKERKISAIFLSASRDYGEKKYSSAMKKLSEILRIDPSNEEAKKLLAEIKAITSEATVKRKLIEMENDYKKAEYTKVIENVRWILDVQPENEKARVYNYLANARIFISDKKYEEARAELYEVLKIQPASAEALGLLKRIQTVIDLGR